MMNRRTFLRRTTLAVGAVATATYTGLDFLANKVPAIDTVARALGLRSNAGIPEWDVEFFSQFDIRNIGRGNITLQGNGREITIAPGGRLSTFWPLQIGANVMNIPAGNMPPPLAHWNGLQYERWKYDPNTRRAWYLRKST